MKHTIMQRAEEIMEELREEGCYIDFDEAIVLAEVEWNTRYDY